MGRLEMADDEVDQSRRAIQIQCLTFLIHMNLQSDPQSTYYRLRFCSWQDGVELGQPLERINQL